MKTPKEAMDEAIKMIIEPKEDARATQIKELGESLTIGTLMDTIEADLAEYLPSEINMKKLIEVIEDHIRTELAHCPGCESYDQGTLASDPDERCIECQAVRADHLYDSMRDDEGRF
jgi:hypothetical protein